MKQQKDASIAQKSSGVSVAASPFNGVKLDLALILLALPGLWFAIEYVISDRLWQVLSLLGCSSIAAGYIVLRTRMIKRRSNLPNNSR